MLDANIFYHLESWRGSASDPYTTVYLSQIRTFQRQMTTGAFKIAGGVDLSGAMATFSRLTRRNSISSSFLSKLTKAFLDTLYAFLDGLVHLASDESSNIESREPVNDISEMTATNPLELLDVRDPVCCAHMICIAIADYRQDTRLLLVISNFGHLSRTMIPSMLSELETALGISVQDDKQVSYRGLFNP